MSLFGKRGRSARPTKAGKMPLIGPKETAGYRVGDRVECVVQNNYLREYHGIVPGVKGTVSREPDGELDGKPTGMLILWDSCGTEVRCGFNEVKKAEEGGSAMTEQKEFKVGDTIRLIGDDWGEEPEDPQPGDEVVVIRVDRDGDAVFIDDEGRQWFAGLADPGYGADIVQPKRTLAEKRADDFRVLEEASRPWRSAPDYYKFPHDVQTTDISMHLNSNGGQAVGYISRSTRIDGQNKEEDPRESLRKAIDLIQMEIYRLDEKFGDNNN